MKKDIYMSINQRDLEILIKMNGTQRRTYMYGLVGMNVEDHIDKVVRFTSAPMVGNPNRFYVTYTIKSR